MNKSVLFLCEMFVLMQCYLHNISEKFINYILISQNKLNIETQLIFLYIIIKSHISSSIIIICKVYELYYSHLFLTDRYIKNI